MSKNNYNIHVFTRNHGVGERNRRVEDKSRREKYVDFYT
jgi:hypothetical protein